MIRLLLALACVLVTAPAWAQCANTGVTGTPYQGFGADTTGGNGQTNRIVTNLNNSGTGSLRAAIDAGAGCITFQSGVAGTITITSPLNVQSNVTIDGFSASSPGVTLNCGATGLSNCLVIDGSVAAKDNVIIRGIRVRGAGSSQGGDTGANSADCISIRQGVTNVVISHVSVNNCGDGGIDVDADPPTLPVTDVTISNNIISNNTWGHQFESTQRISHFGNLLYKNRRRNPQITTNAITSSTTDVAVDYVNNLTWGWGTQSTTDPTNSGGMMLRAANLTNELRVNVRDNYFFADGAAANLTITRGLSNQFGSIRSYIDGNVSGDSFSFDVACTQNGDNCTAESGPFTADDVTTTDACTSAASIRANAGVRSATIGLDAIDQAIIAAIPASVLTACIPAPPPPPSGGETFADSLTGTEALVGHTPETGTTWVELFDTAGTQAWTIANGNGGSNTALESNDRVAYCTDPAPSVASYSFEVALPALDDGGDDPFCVFARATSSTSYYAVCIYVGAPTALLILANTSTSQLASATGITWQAGDILGIEVSDDAKVGYYKRADTRTDLFSSGDNTLTAAGNACVGGGNAHFTSRVNDDIVNTWRFDDASLTEAAAAPTPGGKRGGRFLLGLGG